MKRLELFFLFIRLPLDYAAVFGAALAAYFLRYGVLADIRPATQLIAIDEYLLLVFGIALLWIFIFALTGLYLPRLRIMDELARVVNACSTGAMAVVVIFFFSREFFASRFIVLAAFGLAIVFVVIVRLLIRAVQMGLWTAGIGSRQIAVVGSGRPADAVISDINAHPSSGYVLVGRFESLDGHAVDELRKLVRHRAVDELFLLDATLSDDERSLALAVADELHLTVRYSADLLGARRAAFDVTAVAGVPLIEIKKTPLEGWGRIAKRLFDLVVGLVLFVLTVPLDILIVLAVAFDSRGPVFYIRRRVGEEGRLFPFLKFRTMRVGAPEDVVSRSKHSVRSGPVPKLADDSEWVTRVGRFLRRWSLDELPQFLNVVLGHMSLVGPRPHLPDEVALYAPHQKKVLSIKPGITGLAQVSGRADLSFDEEVSLDSTYIERWSMKMDLGILFKTPFAVIKRRGAY